MRSVKEFIKAQAGTHPNQTKPNSVSELGEALPKVGAMTRRR
jgi:hypothetical protein